MPAPPCCERPLVAMQSLDNARDVTVCRNCLGFAGDLISQLELLSGVPRHECLQRHRRRYPAEASGKGEAASKKRAGAGQLSPLYDCREGCGEVYCSAECRSRHWDRCHRLLCVGPVPDDEAEDHPLVAFRVHAVQTNEIFLLVGEVMAQIAASFASDSPAADDDGRLAAARSPFADFVQEPWWDVAVPRDDSDQQAAATSSSSSSAPLQDTLRALCEESSDLLRRAFALALGPLPAPLELALTAERFGKVVGMFEQNNVGVRAPSPIPDVLRELLSEAEGGGGAGRPNGTERAAEREVLLEAAELVEQMMGGGCDDEDDGSEEGGEGQGCCGGTAAAGCAAAGEKKAAAGKACASARAAGDHGGEEELGPEEALAVLRSAVDGGDGGGCPGGEGEEEDLFAPLDGTALYTLICCMNHSCRPNCVVRYPGRRGRRPPATKESGDVPAVDASVLGAAADPLLAEVVLLEDVSDGEELTQSYVTREMGWAERREALVDYGFLCTCPRCVEEEGAGGVSA